MTKTRVKICGITNENDLCLAANAGADAVGFIVDVESSPRNLTVENASSLIRKVPIFTNSVVVTVSKDVKSLRDLCAILHPNALQIHSDRDFSDFKLLKKEFPNVFLIRAIKAYPSSVEEKALFASKNFDAVLLDSFVKGKYGGTGVVHDWKLSRHIKQIIDPTPLILAGGLNPENVTNAINYVKPHAVDVSSGVEKQPGIKDQEKIESFIKNVRKI